jgi:hypothetical protein
VVFRIRKNGVQVGTATIAVGNTHATYAVAADIDVGADDLFELLAPAVPDATMAGLIASLVAYR